jgi:hypothetical protein
MGRALHPFRPECAGRISRPRGYTFNIRTTANMSLDAKWTAGILQDANPERLSKHHAFCVFHPGVGTNFRYPYKAFKAMKQTRRPRVLLSAYDLDNAQRDIQVLAPTASTAATLARALLAIASTIAIGQFAPTAIPRPK